MPHLPADSKANMDSGNPVGPTHIIQPLNEHTHTHTAVLLHGRGSTGEEFAEDLFESKLSSGKSLREEQPSWRWVFPSSRELWSTAFQEHMPAWFEAHSLTDTTARQDLQVDGIKDSVAHICGILDAEIELLDGKPEKLVLGGISQGGATAMWTLLCWKRRDEQRFGAFIGSNTWLPFAQNIRKAFTQLPCSIANDQADPTHSEFDDFVKDMMAPLQHELRQTGGGDQFLLTPDFMGHGIDHAYVDVELGREASGVLSSIGLKVEWKEYTGAEHEGHWFKTPEELDDIRCFLSDNMA